MAMKKNISKALAMAVMMSVLAGGSAYAAYDAGGGTATGSFSIAIGDEANATAQGSIAIGENASASGDQALAIGYKANASEKQATAVGNFANAISDGTALGYSATVSAAHGVAIGSNSEANAADSIAIGDSSVADEANTVSVGGGMYGTLRRITNLDAGTNDTDAVNKKQLDDAIAAIETASYDDTAIKSDIADHETRISALETSAGGGASSEALEKLDSKINQTNDRVDRVGATAAALAGINYQPMAKGQSQVAVGLGGYKGKKATALGLAYQFNDRVSGSVAGAANGSEHMFNIGFNYLFGQHSDKDIAQMAAAPGSVSLKEAEMQSTIDAQGAKINTLEAEIAELKAMVKALAAK